MGTNIKDQVDLLLMRDEPPELAGMPRGTEENGALRKAIEASIKYWNAWRDAQFQLIDLEDEKELIAVRQKRTRRAWNVAAGAAVVSVGIMLGNLAAVLWW